jgi:hypothetical protein
VVGPNGPVLCVKGVDYNMQNNPILAAFGITPSPHRRTTEPSLLLASPTSMSIGNTIFAHPECGGGSGRAIYFYVWKGCKHPNLAAFGITPSLHR